MENTETNQVNQEQAAPQAEGQAAKLFTQEELNRIVSDRLERERKKFSQEAEAAKSEQEAAYAEREKNLTARESRLNCREYVKGKGYPEELLDALDTSDYEKFKKSADSVCAALGWNKPKYRPEPPKGYIPPKGAELYPGHDGEFSEAFANKPHTPKGRDIYTGY